MLTNTEYLAAQCALITRLVRARIQGAAPGELQDVQRERERLAVAAARAVDEGAVIPGETLRRRFGLSDVDLSVLWAVLAPSVDPDTSRAFRELRGGVFWDGVTTGLLKEGLGATLEERLAIGDSLSPTAPLIAARLVSVAPARTSPGMREVSVPTRIANYLTGRSHPDELVLKFCQVVEPTIELEHVILTDRVRRTVLDILENHDAYRERLQEWGYPDVLPSGKGIALLFSGPPGTGKTRFANAVARHLGKRLLRVRCAQLRESPDAIEPVLDELVRESVVQDGIVFFDDCEALFGDRSAKLSALLEFMESYESIMILATNRPQTLDAALERRIIHQVDFEVPGPLLREQLWELHLPPGAPVSGDIDVPALATAYNFAGGTIKNAVLMAINKALARDPEQPKLDMALLEAAANAQLRYRLEDFTRVTVTPLTLKDVVLPEEQRESVAEVLAACRSRTRILNEWGFGKRLVTGKGIVILFDGPPGTGKTLTAEILANELGKSLYRVDVPSVVSKYIGETEKHLVEIFDRARASRSMLLFDEADSLFGRRVEARSSTDRYANMEVNLLLQEIERFEGIIMLTTNLFGGLDDAVRRRISYRVTFPEPDVDARRLIWRSLLPSEAPLDDDVDLQLLARTFDISGGLIKNAVLRGAHRAMDDGTAISMRHLLEAGREECRSAGKVVRVVPKAAKPTPVSEAS